jgi:hypothetical protein
MNKLHLVAEMLRYLYSYCHAPTDITSLEQLAELRRIIAKAELTHRRPQIIDPLDNEDGL